MDYMKIEEYTKHNLMVIKTWKNNIPYSISRINTRINNKISSNFRNSRRWNTDYNFNVRIKLIKELYESGKYEYQIDNNFYEALNIY